MVLNFPAGSPLYSLVAIGSMVLGGCFFYRRAKSDPPLFLIYLVAIISAFVGAKLGYIAAEGWNYAGSERFIITLASGKTLLGGLLLGYAGIEVVKRWLGYSTVTGDMFATVVPLAVLMGRIGCLFGGCCRGLEAPPSWYTVLESDGVHRYATLPAEMIFQLSFVVVAFLMRRAQVLVGQHFHLYLISYGAFRFLEEFFRQAPRIGAGLTGYHVLALMCICVGALGFSIRAGWFGSKPPLRSEPSQ